MNHMLLFEKWQNKKKPIVLILHGLEGHHDNKQLKILEEIGFQPLAISFDYNSNEAWNSIKDIEVDGVIGHSLGGYLAYYFSNYKKIPCLMFMPDFGKEMSDLQPIPKEILDLPIYKDKLVIIGTEDEDVDKNKNEEMLKNIKSFEIKSDHVPSLSIFKKYCKLFKTSIYQ